MATIRGFGEAAFLHVNLLGQRAGIHSFNLSRFPTSGQLRDASPADFLSAGALTLRF
jgi:hypothetical protein